MIRSHRRWSFLAVALCCPLVVFGGQLPKNFTLGRYVPADSWFMVHAVHNPERGFIAEHWQEVFDALSQSGIEQDLANLILSMTPESKREQLQKDSKLVTDALRSVAWSSLGSKEMVFSQRMAAPMPNYLVLFRSDPAKVGEHVASLTKVMTSVASLSESLHVEETKIGETQIWRLAVKGPIVIELFRHRDMIGLSTGRDGVANLQPLLLGEKKVPSFIDTPEFAKAMAGVDTPEDMVMYFGIHRLVDQVLGMMKALPKGNDHRSEHKKKFDGFRRIFTRGMRHVDFIDSVMVSTRTDGLRERTHEVVTLLPDAQTKPFTKALTQRTTFDRFDKYVPVDATGFGCSTLLDVNMLHDQVIDFLKTEFPEKSKEWLARWEEMQTGVNFHVKEDLLSWISGEVMQVSLPAVGMQAGSVLMIRLSDPKLAKEKIDGFIARVQAKSEELGLVIKPMPEVEAKGFYSVMHPMMMMMQVRPVVGIHDEWLVIGSGPQDVNKVLAAGKAGAKTIRDSERFKAEGVRVSGAVTGASFTDLEMMGQQLAMGLSMGGMMGAMAVQGGDEVAPIRAMFAMMAKLGPVAAEMDFFKSSSSVTTFDGRRWTTRSVLNYKPREEVQAD